MRENINTILAEGREVETKAKNPALDDTARAEAQAKVGQLQQQLVAEQRKLEQFSQQAQQMAQEGQQKEMAPLQQKAIEAVKTVAKDKGIDLVIPMNSAIYVGESLEISDAVIALLNSAE
jgi:Skp family chaperone for outer membrane proteins